MLREGEGIAAKALSDTGADYSRVREVIEDDNDQRAVVASRPQPFSTATMRIIERSVQISWVQAAGDIGTEHLLVGLLEEEDGTIEIVLAVLDITPQEVVLRVNALLAD
jgi:ATP-dependent Clp protease ATP-binding subunit ClpC